MRAYLRGSVVYIPKHFVRTVSLIGGKYGESQLLINSTNITFMSTFYTNKIIILSM
jgi:hypothetical protein